MDKLMITGISIASIIVGYKVGIYATAYYKLNKEKKQKIVDLNKYSEWKEKLDKEKED
jgi:hypothetical protein